MALAEQLDKINALEALYASYTKSTERLREFSRIVNSPKATPEEKQKALDEVKAVKLDLEKFTAENGSGDDILAEIKLLRQDYVRVKYLTIRGSNVTLNAQRFEQLDESKKAAFKIELQADVVRNFQNENVYIGIDLNSQRNVKIALPSIQNSLKSQNVNLWISDESGTIGGEFSLEIIGDEDSGETISGNESVVLTESFSGALITPISLSQWGIFYASSITSGTFERDLSQVAQPSKSAAPLAEAAATPTEEPK